MSGRLVRTLVDGRRDARRHEVAWDGNNGSGTELAEGVYYYVCRVFEQRVTGTEESTDVLSGYIELIRGNSE